ncbi:Hsp70 family protein [Solwaraspora sp. WMMB335]|uniref:Hsp70 family protein n=1 Tax=Solwaraspora sp. WMMB335 TaxID=3404118 RepID=UPI003B951323
MNTSVRLAVDLGTTHTVAVVRRGDEPPRPLLFDGTPLLASGVFVDATGGVHTGRDAQRLAAGEPHRFEPHPKRRIDDGSVLLGERELPVARLLGAALRRVTAEAAMAGVHPSGATVLTCPADWGTPRRDLLRAAAAEAGLGPVRLLDEPIAAAAYCRRVLGRQIPPGGSLAVFDFGGGTLDVAVVRHEAAGLRVLATGGLDDLGGLDVDNALVAHLGQLVAMRDPRLWSRLSRPVTAADRRDRHAFWTEVRAAKEMLSRTAVAPVTVPGRDDPMHLTREELDRVAGPLVDRAVDETRRVLQLAGVDPARLAGLLLVGGASRMPLVASRLHARLGVAPAVPEQPELPVAYGALHHEPAAGGPTRSTATPFPPPVPPPSSPPPPTSSAFVPPARDPGQPVKVPLTPAGRPRRPRPARRRVTALATVAVLVAVVAIGGTVGTRWLTDTWRELTDAAGDGVRGLTGGQLTGGGGDTSGDLRPVADLPLGDDVDTAALIVAPGTDGSGEQAVYAAVQAGATTVGALAPGGGQPVWTTEIPVEPATVALTAVNGLILVDAFDSATDAGADMRVVLAASDGEQLWKGRWEDRADVVYYGRDVIVEIIDGIYDNGLARVDLTTGTVKWRRDAPDDDLLTPGEARVQVVSEFTDSPDTVPGGAGLLPPAHHALYDSRHGSAEHLVELNEDSGRGFVLDPADRTVVASGTLPLDDSRWTAVGGLAIGVLSTDAAPGATVLAAIDLATFDEVWRHKLSAAEDVERVKPCGPDRVCAAVEHSANDRHRTVAFDTATGEQRWEHPVEWSDDEDWFAAPGGQLLVGDDLFGVVDEFALLDPAGEVVAVTETFTSAAAIWQGRAAVLSNGYDVATEQAVQQIAVWDMATGGRTARAGLSAAGGRAAAVGMVGDVVAVLTEDHQVRVFRVDGLA